jgi:hypothetical protein
MWEELTFALSAVGFIAATALLLVELRDAATRVVETRRHH